MAYLPQNKLAHWRESNKPIFCPILETKMSNPVVDHDHKTGEVRGVINNNANALLGVCERKFFSYCSGKPEDLPSVLRNMADYLEQASTMILHPVGLNQLCTRFSQLPKEQQLSELKSLGAKENKINACNNNKQRKSLYRTLTKLKYERHTTVNSD
jgi:hypothetical protein